MSEEEKERIGIGDEDDLYRRIHPKFRKENRVSSAVFKTRDPELSLVVARLSSTEEALNGFDGFGLACITAGFLRSLNLEVYHDPFPENYAHAIAYGKITDSMANMIARNSILLK